ncbi:MAG TPA: 50S ribosomal protein L11 methyltransferase [Solirubrobacteraceae bacterium]|nr:50S ribosomal protein L11 methyltransferase [Solirubrobacteraceae bacterium]
MIRLALRVAQRDAEIVLADLLELAPAGVEEVELPADDGREAQVEYAIYGSPGELPELPQLHALAGGVRVQLSSSEVPDDWAERWKRFHEPVLIEAPARMAGLGAGQSGNDDAARSAASLHVRPPWEPPSQSSEAIEIVIDPAQAFGTGSHATTRLCLELLLALAASDPARPSVLDVGTGSGVLAIAAAKLGYSPVLALDNDPLSVKAAAANARVAGVAIDVRRHDLRSPTPSAPLVIANLLRPLLVQLADSLERIDGRAPAHVIASGLLCEEAAEVGELLAARLDLSVREHSERGEWAALWLSRD